MFRLRFFGGCSQNGSLPIFPFMTKVCSERLHALTVNPIDKRVAHGGDE